MRKNKLITRRNVIITRLTTIDGLILPGCGKKPPPTYGNILRMGDALTYHAQRALLPGQSFIELQVFNKDDIFESHKAVVRKLLNMIGK